MYSKLNEGSEKISTKIRRHIEIIDSVYSEYLYLLSPNTNLRYCKRIRIRLTAFKRLLAIHSNLYRILGQ